MTPIEFRPPTIEKIIESPYAEKRLKNRTGKAYCSNCNFREEGFVMDVYTSSKDHDKQTGHNIVLSEDACRMGLIQQKNS